MTTPATLTIDFLRAVLASADMGGHRGTLDTFADRLIKAASEPSLTAAIEHLLRATNTQIDGVSPPIAARMVTLASGPDGPRVLRWWREQAKLIALLAGTRDETVRAEALAAIALPDAQSTGHAATRGAFPIALHVTCEAPLSHGADRKAGNATLFRRMQVLTDDGVAELPYYAGNALRGQMRDLLADHLLTALGLPASRTAPAVALWFFYALYSGGALEEQSDATKALRKAVGDHGALRAMGIRQFRETLPALSLLGCALGNRILAGRCQVADLRPVCAEWGTGPRPVAELLGWEYLTRREDHEEHIEHHGMIATTEILKAGTVLEGGLDHDDAIGPLERAALGRGLQLLIDRGRLGAENRRGLGRVVITAERLPDPAPYDVYLVEHKAEILAYLDSVGALAGLLTA